MFYPLSLWYFYLFIYLFREYISSFLEPEGMLLRSDSPPLDYKNFKFIA
jgi:hypothetical protein